MDQYEETHSSIISVQHLLDDEIDRYDIVTPLDRCYQVKNFVEKPALGTAPSNLAIMGRYVRHPEISTFLAEQHIGAGDEIRLTDTIQKLNEIQPLFAYDLEGKRYGEGDKLNSPNNK